MRLCGLVNGSVVGGVLPSAQFCNTLTHSVLRLWLANDVAPYVLHATWMRLQEEHWKLMRLREQQMWHDPQQWYGAPSALSVSTKAVRFLTYDAELPAALRHAPMIGKGALPLHHLKVSCS